MMTNPREAYEELAQWVDVSNHPDKEQFESLLGDFVQSVINAAVNETREDANSGTEHVGLIQEYAEHRNFNEFFTSDR
jgi:hypothetical protein